MRNFAEYLKRKREEWGAKFDASELVPTFVPFFESGQRIRVLTLGIEKTGTVGVTTGWRPAFLLMVSSRAMGSPWILTAGDKVLAVKVGRRYVPVQEKG